LKAEDGGVKFLIEIEGGAKFKLRGGVEGVDVVGEYPDVGRVDGGKGWMGVARRERSGWWWGDVGWW
jgi:hypothetical protein